MNVSLRKLCEEDFSLLLKWLEAPHVKAWWDQDVVWDMAKVKDKYQSYVAGYKLVHGKKKPLAAYIIEVDAKSVGYIQYYAARDFIEERLLNDLPENTVAIDMYIGEFSALKCGVGSQSLSLLINEALSSSFDVVIATPDKGNFAAIACYQRAGFQLYAENLEQNELWMLKFLDEKAEKTN